MKESIRVLMITSEYPTSERPTAVPFIARQVEYLRRSGIDLDVFHLKGKKKLTNYIRAWWELRKFKKGKEYDLIHAQWGHSAAIAFPKRLPWVITFRGNDLEGIIGSDGNHTFLGRILRSVSKITARFADSIILVSESLARNISRSDYQIIPSGLDLELFRPLPKSEARKLLGLPDGKKLVLFAASRIENPRKRYSLAKSAIEILKDRFDIELIVATKTPHDQIPIYMSACDSLLLTSVHEGSPNVIKESLACNLPVVSVDVGDVRRRIENINGCYVCENGTAEEIAASLEKVLIKGGRIEGRETVSDLDENRIAKRVIEVYRDALAGWDAKKNKGFFGFAEHEKNIEKVKIL